MVIVDSTFPPLQQLANPWDEKQEDAQANGEPWGLHQETSEKKVLDTFFSCFPNIVELFHFESTYSTNRKQIKFKSHF